MFLYIQFPEEKQLISIHLMWVALGKIVGEVDPGEEQG
jgi:hypothetical protein